MSIVLGAVVALVVFAFPQMLKATSEGVVTSPPPVSAEVGNPCFPRYSRVSCTGGNFVGRAAEYGFSIYNRSCLFENVTYDRSSAQFVFYSPVNPAEIPLVTLAPRGFDLPIMGWKRQKVIRKMRRYHEYRPSVVYQPIPCDVSDEETTLLYYSPIVAPWNYAHTLLCDLFGLFWAMIELRVETTEGQVVAVGAHYGGSFPLPNNNAAFRMFSRRAPVYESDLPQQVSFRRLIAGSGTKSWSWVTSEYKASGSADLWWKFRQHIIKVTKSKTREAVAHWSERLSRQSTQKIRVSVCHKKDKRGVVNYEEIRTLLASRFPNADFVLESAVGLKPREQVEMMLATDIFICNEGTLATSFFLMPPGSAFISLPLVYHQPHLHQRSPFSHPSEWWREPDLMRQDPRKNTGGNIDWFPPAIPWVRTSWYDQIPLNETQILLPLVSLRNYMPNYNIILRLTRLLPLVTDALDYVLAQGELGPNPNYSVNAQLCRAILARSPELTKAFNTAKCYYSMSWLCECWSNTNFRWRFLHEKWRLSKGHCGSNMSSINALGLRDPREARPLQEYLFFTETRLRQLYTRTDMGSFTIPNEEVAFLSN